MFRIAQRLSDICTADVLAEKLVLAPSLAIGHQIADAIAQSGTPWVNLRIQTIRTLADAVAGFALATEGITLLSRAQALALIERACDRVLDSSSYFAALADRPGLHRAIQKSIDDLRHAGINPAEIKAASFEDARKAEDLAKILAAYDEEMRAGGYVDRFGVLARATSMLEEGALDLTAPHLEILRSRPPSRLAQDDGVAPPSPVGVPRAGMTPLPWGRDAIWLVVDDVELTASEERFLKAAAGSWETVSSVGTDAAPLKIAFRRAVGEENEVRGAFRAVLEDKAHFDDAEIVYTTRDTYLPLIYELAAEYEVPTTFAEGVASHFTRPGQACLAFLRWIGEGWHARELRVFAGGHGRVLRRAGIGWGRERYLPRIDALIAQEQEELAGVVEEPSPGVPQQATLFALTPDPSPKILSRTTRPIVAGRGERGARRIKEAQEARAFVVELLSVSSPVAGEGIDVAAAARAASEFVRRFGVTRNEVDGMAKEGLTRLFEELAAVGTALRGDSGVAREVPRPSRTPAQARDDMRRKSSLRPMARGSASPRRSEIARRLAEAVRELHVAASNPRPGHLHVAPVRAGGWSARSRMFVVGLDDERHPGSGLQDPIILDSEREAIGIPIVGDRPQRTTEEFRRLLERANKGEEEEENKAGGNQAFTHLEILRSRPTSPLAQDDASTPALHGGVTLSWATMSMKERRERFPSPALLAVYREATGKPEATFEEMTAKVAKENFVGPQPLAPSEWWLLRRFMDRDTNLRDAILHAYPGLGHGAEAEQARDSSEITPWDGKINAPPELLDPRLNNRVYSASQLEKMASCPYQYFLDRILHIQPLDELQFEPDTWLEAHQFGTLLHDVLQKTMEELCASGQKPSVAFLRRMQEIAEDALAEWRREIPPPSEAAFARRRTELIDSCEIFLRNEEVACGTVTPKYFELEFKNFRLPLGKGRSVELRGKIDRVDHDEARKEWHVWDYKSGSTWAFDQGGQLQCGTKIQHAIYARAVEDKVGGRVTRSGYFFPTPKGNGARLPRGCTDQELKEALNLLFDTIRSGYFPHSDEDACRFCDFQQICGGAKLGAERTARKLARNTADPAVAAWLRLQDVK